MNILYYYWNENSAEDMISSLEKLGHQVKQVSIPFANYDSDSEFCKKLSGELENTCYDFIFTFDFFPIISKVAQDMKLPYICWIYDMPHTTLFSPQLKNPVNHILIFDRELYYQLQSNDYPCHLYHLPLSVNTERIVEEIGMPPLHTGSKYQVSFVGSLYENCFYNRINYLPEYLEGYLNGAIAAQQKVYGYNFVRKMLTPNIIQELQKWVSLEIPAEYQTTYLDEFADLLNAKITSVERIHLLNKIAGVFPFVLFSGSDGKKLIPEAQYGGIIDYQKGMPAVFRTSKINMNITLRSIVSGIPLRAMDIMGAGGFLMSNYQPELAEFFVEGEDCILFDSEDDMMNKIEYFLSHEKERSEIACNGFHKTKEYFSYEKQIPYILSLVFGENKEETI